MESKHHQPGITTYIFGPFRFIPQRQLLLRGGLTVRIGGRALDILTLLVRRAGDIVSKNELLTFCWPSTYVHESNLKVNVAALRKALAGEEEESYIATVAGRGYRFVAEIEVQRAESSDTRPPALQSLPNLQLTEVIGRADEISSLAEKLKHARCLTIVGPGGMGKTTIALALGHSVLAEYSEGVCFIDLSTVGDAQYAIAAIAAGVGARQRSEDTLSEIISLLHGQHMLLILDNCEHLSPTVSSIAKRLLNALPTIRIFATSREPLQIEHEEVYRLPHLSLPGPGEGTTAAGALEFGAVRLFVARASGRRANYVLSDADAPLVSAICRRIDGIPLAIEMVASKTFPYGLPTLLAMLEQRFLLFSNGERTAPLRQQTLLATLDWSYRLLSDDEAALLRLVSVFAGMFRLEDATGMAEALSFDATQTIDGLERLTSKSLICADYQDGALNYRLLESTRAYATERLSDEGEREDALRRHAWQILALFERAASEQESRKKTGWMAEYAHRIDDVRNAMSWAFSPNGDQMLGVRLTAAAIPLWYELSSLNEMQSRVERALLATKDLGDCPKEVTMKLIAAKASGMSFAQHLPLDTEMAWKECYKLGVESGNAKYQIFSLWGLCSYLIYTGRPREGLAGLKDFISLAESQSDWSAVDEAYRMMATAEIYIGEISSARRRLERLAAQNRKLTDPIRFARFQAEKGVAVRCSLSLVLWISGEVTRAMQVTRAAVERAEISGHVVSHSNALAVFAVPLSFWCGDYDSTERFLEAIDLNGQREDIGVWRESCLFFKAAVRAKQGQPGAAHELKARLRELIAARNILRAPMHYSMVAEALLDAGSLTDAQDLIGEAKVLAIDQDANWCLPEIIRISALIELRCGKSEEAEILLRESITRASAMGALALEIRASLSLSRKLVGEGRLDEACDLLNTSCGRFRREEAFPDLAAARELLLSLQSSDERSVSFA
ncbi:helix-turn-helix transcriptional regulator [Rhizobium leguminosarum]|uniref:ATP-binding protein n=1 Tax=Rhizobium leguminosarum TaxID=384 RepID=UPI001C939622|nr:winged helix-turn-helix domain-containing protein [Rhizobium leguminosarum]MBY5537719.1 helix-turn-helix transcriptional regulator [Rhizobium leguminosarum]